MESSTPIHALQDRANAVVEAIVMGASAGAVEALSEILPKLPEHFSVPVMLVVHLPADKHSVLPQLLDNKCRLKVSEADDKELIDAKHVYVAPPDYHLLIESDRRMSLSSEEPVRYSRPSIDVLFETAADVYGAALVGVVLTGANDDGARGLEAIVNAGGIAIVQDPKGASASAMPAAALRLCPQAMVLELGQIADRLIQLAGRSLS